ncbi:MAG: KamA family radical SAM protein [Kiritimatiellae bacterium]|nr:KamA family radical SAM protein [Kiritimatiellia bacterium]
MLPVWQYRLCMKMDRQRTELRRQRALRRRAFPEATAAQWADWHWQLRHRVRTAEALDRMLDLSARERRALARPATWRMPLGITPYYLSLLAAEPPDGPLRRTMLPDLREAHMAPGERLDSLGEAAHQVAPGLVRSYPRKALLLAAGDCACFCRYCTRARTAGQPPPAPAEALAWLRRNPAIRDVLVSGGDPLTLGDARLESILKALRSIPHVELIRIGTKVPATLPQRITPALVRMLRKYRPLWLSLHFIHPAELTPQAAAACRRLLDTGLPLVNQTVLLRNVNDSLEVMVRLNEGLLQMGVKPYYLHQGDLASGTSHLRSTASTGRRILRKMCGLTTGYAVPLFMFDRPGGGGKVPLGPAGSP